MTQTLFPRLRLAVFDLDGTLVELELEHFAQQIETTLHKMKLYCPSRDKLLEVVAAHKFSTLFESIEQQNAFWHAYEEGEVPTPKLFDRSLVAVEAVVARGMDVAIATARKTNTQEMRSRLEHTGLMKHVELLSTFHGTGWKDKTEQLRQVCKAHRIEPRAAMMVGDTEDDLKSSRDVGFGLRLGMSTGVTPVERLQVHKPFRILSCIGEVPSTIDEYHETLG